MNEASDRPSVEVERLIQDQQRRLEEGHNFSDRADPEDTIAGRIAHDQRWSDIRRGQQREAEEYRFEEWVDKVRAAGVSEDEATYDELAGWYFSRSYSSDTGNEPSWIKKVESIDAKDDPIPSSLN